MKTKVRIALVALLGITLFVCGLPISSAAPTHQGERIHAKKGREVGSRVRQLQKYNSKVRQALGVFEDNAKRHGHKNLSRPDEAVSITQDPSGGSAALKAALAPLSPFRKAGFKPQDPDYSGYGVEMIFVPAYTTATEWQGTVIFNEYDPSGAYLGDYVADVAVVLANGGDTGDVIEEISYEDGEALVQYGTLTFEFGAPIDSQDPPAIQPIISSLAGPQFKSASFDPMPQRFGGPHFGIPSTPK